MKSKERLELDKAFRNGLKEGYKEIQDLKSENSWIAQEFNRISMEKKNSIPLSEHEKIVEELNNKREIQMTEYILRGLSQSVISAILKSSIPLSTLKYRRTEVEKGCGKKFKPYQSKSSIINYDEGICGEWAKDTSTLFFCDECEAVLTKLNSLIGDKKE